MTILRQNPQHSPAALAQPAVPPNLSARPTPVLLTDQFNITIPNGAPHLWIPNPSGHRIDAHHETISWVNFSLVVFVWALYSIHLVVVGNSRRQKAQANLRERRLSYPLDERFQRSRSMEAGCSAELRMGFDSEGTTIQGNPGIASKGGLGTEVVNPRKSIRRGLDGFPE
ncbi:hypothetical protein E8E12_009201 [Didymella heteroderae]|uniref:Uncharacterized protein n=1 Tax=Didymella heteroderae TaxID=1769908 RepID=A0A9P5C2L4_9PLEO|nr:hypothetical protein E8E12_009201 [Didymella heteroderae]